MSQHEHMSILLGLESPEVVVALLAELASDVIPRENFDQNCNKISLKNDHPNRSDCLTFLCWFAELVWEQHRLQPAEQTR